MIESRYPITKGSKAAIVSIMCPKLPFYETVDSVKNSLSELRGLLKTLDIGCQGEFFQKRTSVDATTIVGIGKLKNIAKIAKERGSQLLVFDIELTAGQMRNINEITSLTVVDRVYIILEIFAQHARTREAKIQIEMARLKYFLPRLTGLWSHFSKQRGGVGTVGGEGEKQIELDRRMIRKKIGHYQKELLSLKKTRLQQKKKRQHKAITAALVGYTNAGKSSLMNRLCKVDILEENKFFATLDSTYRMMSPDTHPPMLLIDTVGFISNLPGNLVDGFRTTLESAQEADLLIIVCDISNKNCKQHLEITYGILKKLALDNKDHIVIFNKRDLLQDCSVQEQLRETVPQSFLISSYNENDIKWLRNYIVDYFLKKQNIYDLFVPYEKGPVHSIIASKTNVLVNRNHRDGIYYRVRVPHFIFNSLGIHRYRIEPYDIPYLLETTSKI